MRPSRPEAESGVATQQVRGVDVEESGRRRLTSFREREPTSGQSSELSAASTSGELTAVPNAIPLTVRFQST